jgi:type I restriction enzyme M protein
MSLSSTIKTIQDIMRKDDGVDGDAQRIGQLTWMLFREFSASVRDAI